MAHWSKIPAGELQAALQRLLPAFEGNASDVIRCLNLSPKFLTDVVSAIQPLLKNAIAETRYMYPGWGRAEAIMGPNFFGPVRMLHAFGIIPSQEELDAFGKIPWDADFLSLTKDTHILVAVYPLSIQNIQMGPGRPCFMGPYEAASYRGRDFATNPGMIGWHLIRKKCITNSRGVPHEALPSLILEGERLLSARALVYALVGGYLTTREWFCGQGFLTWTSTNPTSTSSLAVGCMQGDVVVEVVDNTSHRDTAVLTEVCPHF